MGTLAEFQKVPLAKRDYTLNWARNAPGDAIVSIVWTVPAGLTSVATSNTASTTTIRLSGGTSGVSYLVSCKVTRASGEVDERSITITIVDSIIVLRATKDPSGSLIYTISWAGIYGDDSVSTYAWAASGLTIVGASNAASVQLAGGATPTDYLATCHTVTVGGQEDERSILISVQDL